MAARASLLALVLALLDAPAPAAGEDLDNNGLIDDVEEHPTTAFAQIGFGFGAREVGPFDSFVHAFVASAGVRRAHHALYAEVLIGHQDGEGTEPVSGVAGGITGHVRREVAALVFGDEDDAGYLGCWIDVGVGAQAMRLADTTIVRPELSFAVGGGGDFIRGRKSIGLDLGLRLAITPSSRFDATAGRCSAGCAMDLSRFDVAALMVVTAPFAR